MRIIELSQLLEECINGGKKYFNFSKKSSLNCGEYFSHIWTARSNKEKARNLFIKKCDLLNNASQDIFNFLLEQDALKIIKIEDGEYKDEHIVPMPLCLELLKRIKHLDNEIEVDNTLLNNLMIESKEEYYKQITIETLNRIQVPLMESDDLMEKSAIFALFLLLTGAVSKETALILKEDENREIEYQDSLVEYLNNLSKEIFGDSYNNKGKQFSVGDFSNFLRRNKDLRVAYGELFKKENEYIYFNLISESTQSMNDSLQRVLKITLTRLVNSANDIEDIEISINKLVENYRFNNPLKQSHRRALYVGQIDFKYGIVLEELIRNFFMTYNNEEE